MAGTFGCRPFGGMDSKEYDLASSLKDKSIYAATIKGILDHGLPDNGEENVDNVGFLLEALGDGLRYNDLYINGPSKEEILEVGLFLMTVDEEVYRDVLRGDKERLENFPMPVSPDDGDQIAELLLLVDRQQSTLRALRHVRIDAERWPINTPEASEVEDLIKAIVERLSGGAINMTSACASRMMGARRDLTMRHDSWIDNFDRTHEATLRAYFSAQTRLSEGKQNGE